jgi:4-amino-4-deoxy-L-arabinose transferase-like glycosyltransferase
MSENETLESSPKLPPMTGETASEDPKEEDDDAGVADGETTTDEVAAEEKSTEPAGEEESTPPLLDRGNALRKLRGGLTAGLGALFAFLLMAHNAQLRLGVPFGMIFIAVAAWGVMDFLGTFDDADAQVVHATTLRYLAGPILRVLGSTFLFAGALMGGASGLFAQWLWGLIITAVFLLFVVSIYDLGVKLGPFAADELGLPRPLWRRHGFWVLAAGAVLYLPMLGSFSLIDPWETHYGEVAREILTRDDWISLWWAQDGWFWSKPILNFWMQSIAMASLGTHYQPDQMLHGVSAWNAHPEWVVRAPNFLITVVAMYLLYKGVAKVFGRRAGLLGGLVLATMPDWFFLAHQTMTDMPFVASMTAAMGLLLLGLHTAEEAKVGVYEVAVGAKVRFRLSGWHVVFGAILVCALPQILYLLSRNLELVLHGNTAHGFRAHLDDFRSGSGGGNCGLPGNEACSLQNPASIPHGVTAHPEGFGPLMLRFFGAFEPALQALLWSVILGSLLYVNWGERRVRRLFYIGAWFFAAIATMGKGPAGFILPMICAFAYVCTKKRFSELLRLEMLSGLLVILCVAIPWYVAMYVRHGSPFTDRLIFHDMFNRAFSHVHDTNEGDDTSFRFYIWQLGYACFPWTALAPLGLVYWLRRGDSADRGKGDASVFLAMWFIFAFALFSFMGTKFHHYIFPAVPPIAMLIGVVLDDMLGKKTLAPKLGQPIYLAMLGGVVTLAVIGIVYAWPGGTGSILGLSVRTANLYIAGAAVLLLLTRLAHGFLPRPHGALSQALTAGAPPDLSPPVPTAMEDLISPEEEAETEKRTNHEQLMIGAASIAGAFLLGLVGRDLIIKPENADQPGAIRLLQLFTYNYRRSWPENLDFSAALGAFTIVGVVLVVLLSVRKIRPHIVAAFGVFAFVWALWGLDVYMKETAQHWGQRELIEAYYQDRTGPEQPLVAYQMNWKGENFYTGNHVPAFVSSGAAYTTWVKQQRDKGVKVVYFVTEHSRTGGLKGETGAKTYREITTKEICNKFVLVRAEL